MPRVEYLLIRVDRQNPAAEWWYDLGEVAPEFARRLRADEQAVVSAEMWDELTEIPGWARGTDDAPHPVYDCGGWSGAEGSTVLKVFDRLE